MNGTKKEAQISVEYLIIIGFVTVITIPLIIIYYTFTQESGEEIASTQISQIAKKIVDSAESVYYLGEPSQTTLRVNIPDNVALVNLSNYEVVFKMRTKLGEVDIVQSSSVNITGSLPINKSSYILTFKAASDFVNVSYR
tara:strand:- start:2637 stop:3056 length:420 start_codon:yes stop_codon:yes gene_type:complete